MKHKKLNKQTRSQKLEARSSSLQPPASSLQPLVSGSFAIVGDPNDPTTWLLPHHNLKADSCQLTAISIDWPAMAEAVQLLTGAHGVRVAAPPEAVLEAAKHLAEHYQEAKKPIPDALGALI